MKIRAKQSAQINLKDEHGKLQSHYLKGPEFADDSTQLEDGEVIDVPDDFWVNPNVFEVVRELRRPEPERGVPGIYEVIPYPKQKPLPAHQQPQKQDQEPTPNKAG